MINDNRYHNVEKWNFQVHEFTNLLKRGLNGVRWSWVPGVVISWLLSTKLLGVLAKNKKNKTVRCLELSKRIGYNGLA